jgi:hypothetical protein
VTPDGTVSKRGTVSGGYQGRGGGGQGSSPAETLLMQKQELAVLKVRILVLVLKQLGQPLHAYLRGALSQSLSFTFQGSKL